MSSCDRCAYRDAVSGSVVRCLFNWIADPDEVQRLMDAGPEPRVGTTWLFPVFFDPAHGPSDCAQRAEARVDSLTIDTVKLREFAAFLRTRRERERDREGSKADLAAVDGGATHDVKAAETSPRRRRR